MLRPRRSVLELQEYHPPLGSRRGLRLDFNENTAGCSPRVVQRLTKITAEDLARYPDRQPVELLVARHLGLAPEQLLLTNGVDEAIHLLCEAYLEPEDEVLVVAPAFNMYEIYAAATSAQVMRVQADANFEFPLCSILSKINPATRMVAIASPNNPTGTAATRAALLEIARAAPDAALLVDEAYYEFHGKTLLGEIASAPNLFVTRTFSKAYGLAGLRVGLLCGPTTQMQALRRISSPYNVNAIALMALPPALEDQEYVAGYVSDVLQGRERLAHELREIGIQYWPSEANFLLVKIGPGHKEFLAAMLQRGILVRDRSADPGCAGCIRITIGTAAQTDQLISIFKEVWAGLNLSRTVPA